MSEEEKEAKYEKLLNGYNKLVQEYLELEKENKNADERNYSLGLNLIKIGEKLGLENFGIQSILLEIDKLQKENKDLELAYGLYKDTADKLQKENEELKEKYENIIPITTRKVLIDFIKEFCEIYRCYSLIIK